MNLAPKIVIRDVSKIYRADGSVGQELFQKSAQDARPADNIAVAGVSLTIQHGERLGIVGRNGAGKSTLLHMIAGLSSPTTGTIEIDGKVTSVLTLGVGSREDLTGRENIYIDGEIQGKPRQEVDEVIDKIISFAELGDFIDFPVRTYSTGMKARLAFSMISYIDPEILIIDEALSVGDATFAVKATARIKEICARGKIVIIVSHGLGSINDMCNRCLWMECGRIVMDGPPATVTKAYSDSVRAADEVEIMRKFRRFIGTRNSASGWVISQVLIYSGNSIEPRSLLEAGQRMRIELHAVIPDNVPCAKIRAQIIRLDDLVVFDESFPVEDYRIADGNIGLEIVLDPLPLGAAVYRVDISLMAGAIVCAESSSIFEVFVSTPPRGGKPMLFYPITVTTAQTELAKKGN